MTGNPNNTLGLPASNRSFDPIPQGYDVARPGIPRGKLEYLEYASSTIGDKRPMGVYTPPGYSSATKYPVIHLLHGFGGDEAEWERSASASAIFDNLMVGGRIVLTTPAIAEDLAPCLQRQ